MNDGTFPCPIKYTQQSTLSAFVGDLDKAGVAVPLEVRNLAGRINYYATQTPPNDYPVAQDPPMWGGERRSGDNAGFVDTRTVLAVPIPVPASIPVGAQIRFSFAEYRTAPCVKQACFSVKPGDFISRIGFSEGTTAIATCTVGTDVAPGATIYVNVRFWSSDLNGPSTNDRSAGLTYGGGWPA